MTRLAAYRPGTYRNLQSQWRAYLSFSFHFDFTPIPVSENVLCLYVQFLSRTLTVGSIRNYLNGVHLFHGVEYPHHSSFPLKLTFMGLAKLSTHTPTQALPFYAAFFSFCVPIRRSSGWCIALRYLPFSSLLDYPIFCHLQSADLILRVILCRCNVQFIDPYLAVIFSWSKTIQCRERRLVIPLVPISGSPLCPVSAFHHMSQLFPASVTSPAFCCFRGSKLVPLTKSVFVRKFRELLTRAYITAAQLYTGHSFRRGGASYAFRSGVPGELIQVMGDWKSNAYKRYFEFSFETMLSVSLRMRDAIL